MPTDTEIRGDVLAWCKLLTTRLTMDVFQEWMMSTTRDFIPKQINQSSLVQTVPVS